MASIGIFYGSTGGNTESAAKAIAKALGDAATHDVAKATAQDFGQYDRLILGTSTWGEGDLQDDWDDLLPTLDAVAWQNKTVAFFGLGDQEGYDAEFVNAMGTLYDFVSARGAKTIGRWPNEGYSHSDSTAIRDGAFVGLALDEDNQSDLTDERIAAWTASLSGQW